MSKALKMGVGGRCEHSVGRPAQATRHDTRTPRARTCMSAIASFMRSTDATSAITACT
jgi:hypothetical protein